MTPEIQVVDDAEALAEAASAEFARRASAAQDLFTVALAGGSTPRGLYSRLAGDETLRHSLPWDRMHFFWGDERHVPPDHVESNYRMAQEAMLSRLPVPLANVHRIRGEVADADLAALDYEDVLRGFFQLRSGALPRFDLVLLGLGADGHTASLFPATAALDERLRIAVSNRVDKLHAERITLTVPVFNRAACVVFLVSGDDKAEALRAVIEGPRDPQRLPAQLIAPDQGRLKWIVDRRAARLLQGSA
jgi:6-phosphogluconolactonase